MDEFNTLLKSRDNQKIKNLFTTYKSKIKRVKLEYPRDLLLLDYMLYECVGTQDSGVDLIEFMLTEGADPNYYSSYNAENKSVLSKAVTLREGGTEVLERIKLLLDKGANPNIIDHNNGQTALYWAIDHGDTSKVALLLKNGANVNAKDEEGTTPLHHAVLYENHDIIKLLLKNKADTNARDVKGRTPLHCAFHSHIKLLVSENADIDAVDNDGYTPLEWAKLEMSFREQWALEECFKERSSDN